MFFRTRGAAYFSHAEKSGALVSVWKSLRPGAKGRRHSDFLYYSLSGEIVKRRGLCQVKFFFLVLLTAGRKILLAISPLICYNAQTQSKFV